MNVDNKIIDGLFGSWCGEYDKRDYEKMTATRGYVT